VNAGRLAENADSRFIEPEPETEWSKTGSINLLPTLCVGSDTKRTTCVERAGRHHAVANIRPSHWSHSLADTGTARRSTVSPVRPQGPSEFGRDILSPLCLHYV